MTIWRGNARLCHTIRPCRIAHTGWNHNKPIANKFISLEKPKSSAEVTPEPESERTPITNPEVEDALRKVHDAISHAETVIDSIETLPSARMPTRMDVLWQRVLRPLSKYVGLLGYCYITHALHVTSQVMGGVFLATYVGFKGYRNRSLSPSGALAAVAVGSVTLGSSFRCGLVLLAFFFASSALTRFGEDNKDVEEDFKRGGQRNWVQVLANGLIPAVYAVQAAMLSRGLEYTVLPSGPHPLYSFLTAAFLGYYSCCCGDTWSSEVGQLSEQEPRLITTLRPVRKGTNGGVTLLGLGASVIGGVYIGLVFYLTGLLSPSAVFGNAMGQWPLVGVCAAAGLVGSLIDSILGATVQFTGYNRVTGKITGTSGADVSRISGIAVLDNNGVNIVSALLTSLMTGLITCVLFVTMR